MLRLVTIAGLGCLLLAASPSPLLAQSWPWWMDEPFGNRRWGGDRPYRWEQPRRPPVVEREPSRPATGGDVRDGGARPAIAPKEPPVVEFAHDVAANSIVIDTGARKLYYVLSDNRAYQYPISVGREGFNWTGTESVSRKQAWPDWHPPQEMRQRDPSLPEKMTGGVKNPLGATALYLGETLYRIHGTNDVKSIGQAQSSGCFRMLNSAVLHLASITEIGTPVTVVAALPKPTVISRAPEPKPASSSRSEPDVPPELRSRASYDQRPPSVADYRALRDHVLRLP